jgi:hypothetical protein
MSAFVDAVVLGIPEMNRCMREMRTGKAKRGVPKYGGGFT